MTRISRTFVFLGERAGKCSNRKHNETKKAKIDPNDIADAGGGSTLALRFCFFVVVWFVQWPGVHEYSAKTGHVEGWHAFFSTLGAIQVGASPDKLHILVATYL